MRILIFGAENYPDGMLLTRMQCPNETLKTGEISVPPVWGWLVANVLPLHLLDNPEQWFGCSGAWSCCICLCKQHWALLWQPSSFPCVRLLVDIRGSQCSSGRFKHNLNPCKFLAVSSPPATALLWRLFHFTGHFPCLSPARPTCRSPPSSFADTQAVERVFSLLLCAPDLCALTPGQPMEMGLYGKKKLKMSLTLSLAEAGPDSASI